MFCSGVWDVANPAFRQKLKRMLKKHWVPPSNAVNEAFAMAGIPYALAGMPGGQPSQKYTMAEAKKIFMELCATQAAFQQSVIDAGKAKRDL